MITKNYPPTKTWILVHVIFPMLPFIIEGFVRLLILGISLDTFSCSTLAASIGLLCLFVNQNLLARSNPDFPNDAHDEQDNLKHVANLLLLFGLISFVLFVIVVFLTADIENGISEEAKYVRYVVGLYFVKIMIVIWAILSIWEAYKTQKSFKLRALI